MEGIYDWIKNIVYFLLFTTLLRNLLGKEYQKYASLLFGLCLVLQIAEPLAWLKEETSFDFLVDLGELSEYEKENAWLSDAGNGERLEAMVYEEAFALLKQQTAQLVAAEGYTLERLELHVESEDKTGSIAGDSGEMITGFTVWLSAAASEKTGEKASEKAVETVSITDIVIQLEDSAEADNGRKKQTAEQPDDSFDELAMKKKLADFYDMEESHINVIIPMGSNS